VALGMMEEWLPQCQQMNPSEGENLPMFVPSWMDALLLILDQAIKVQHPPNTRPGEPKVPPPIRKRLLPPAVHTLI